MLLPHMHSSSPSLLFLTEDGQVLRGDCQRGFGAHGLVCLWVPFGLPILVPFVLGCAFFRPLGTAGRLVESRGPARPKQSVQESRIPSLSRGMSGCRPCRSRLHASGGIGPSGHPDWLVFTAVVAVNHRQPALAGRGIYLL